jgi:hypothetical protein
MQIFTNAFFDQVKRFGVPSELIFVEWNPPQGKPKLPEALQWPDDLGPCSIRIIEVSPRIHKTFRYSEKLPLFQMIAKNVGIRRAGASFICATNIDVIFDDELMKFLAERTLDPDAMYRLDRYDVPANVPYKNPIQDQLAFCRENVIRINIREGTFKPKQLITRWFHQFRERTASTIRLSMPLLNKPISGMNRIILRIVNKKERGLPAWIRVWFPYKFKPYYLLRYPILRSFIVNRFRLLKLAAYNIFASPERKISLVPPENMRWEEYWKYLNVKKNGSRHTISNENKIQRPLQLVQRLEHVDLDPVGVKKTPDKVFIPQKTLHTNACGDFTLLSKSHWFELRGYPEWEMYSFNIDSFFSYNAYYAGVKEIYLPEPFRFYHIEHAAGWTPEESAGLKKRMLGRGIPWYDWCDCMKMVDQMYSGQEPLIYNDRNWGLGKKNLKETVIRTRGTRSPRSTKKGSRSLLIEEIHGGS